jgi:hypothetical protein
MKALRSGDLALGFLGLATDDGRLPQGDRDREDRTDCGKSFGYVAPVGERVSPVKFDGL